jgi:hypothetical protein
LGPGAGVIFEFQGGKRIDQGIRKWVLIPVEWFIHHRTLSLFGWPISFCKSTRKQPCSLVELSCLIITKWKPFFFRVLFFALGAPFSLWSVQGHLDVFPLIYQWRQNWFRPFIQQV